MEPAGSREYGRAHLSSFDKDNVLFKDVKENTQVWMSHGDTITVIPSNFKKIASTDKVAIAAYQIENEKVWGVQFHPEVFHSEDGTQMLKNFVVDVCGCKQDWSAASFIETTVAELKEQLGDDKVVLGLSGGVFFRSCCIAESRYRQESDLYLRRSQIGRASCRERV